MQQVANILVEQQDEEEALAPLNLDLFHSDTVGFYIEARESNTFEMRAKIYLFSDSITEDSFDIGGWDASVANHFARMVDVVLRGYSGYNTRWVLTVLDRVFPEKPEDDDSESELIVVTVFFGANDACLLDRCSAFQHVPLHEYKLNLRSIVSFFKKQLSNNQVLLIKPPPADEDSNSYRQDPM